MGRAEAERCEEQAGLGVVMRRAVLAGSAYFGIVFAIGFVLGTVRVVLLVPRTGEFAATALELPVMLLASWIACGWTVRHWAVPARIRVRLLMGVLAFVWLMSAEVLLGVLGFGRDFSEQWAALQTPPGLLGLGGQVGFAVMPLLRMCTSGRRAP